MEIASPAACRSDRRLLAALSVVAVAAGGCATNPVTGRSELMLVSAEREKELGRDEARRVEQEMGLLADPALVAYVQGVGQRLAAQSPRRDVEYRFQVIDRTEPNAFALPGGYVYVTRGLLVFVNSEDELAGVIGHEIGHVAARHSVQQISRAAPLAVVTGIGAAVTGVVSPGLGRAVGGAGAAASELILAPYSRDQEREADRVGQGLAAAAGWDPAGLPAFLKTLSREEDLAAADLAGPAFSIRTRPRRNEWPRPPSMPASWCGCRKPPCVPTGTRSSGGSRGSRWGRGRQRAFSRGRDSYIPISISPCSSPSAGPPRTTERKHRPWLLISRGS